MLEPKDLEKILQGIESSEISEEDITELIPESDFIYHHNSIRSTLHTSVKFESGEHIYIGDHANLNFEGKSVPANKQKLYAGESTMGGGNPKYCRYGQIIALGGDFYGIPDQPISTAKDPIFAFKNAYSTFTNAKNEEVDEILRIMDVEINAIKKAVAEGKTASSAYEELGDTLSYQWNQATGGGYGILPKGRYLKLAVMNWDHFGEYAIMAYRAGHQVAMKFASEIRNSNRSPEQKELALQHAYAYNAFADHFLTDLFSAGHLRVPRKDLYDTVSTADLAGLVSRLMHNEDSYYGLKVHNERGDSWTAYGDKRLLDESSKSNLKIVEEAVQASIDEVWQSYETGIVPTNWEALKYGPNLDRVRNTSDKENFSPLFIKRDNKVLCRKDLYNRYDYNWDNFWVAASVYARMSVWNENQVNPEDVTVFLSGAEGDRITLNWKNNGKIGNWDYVALCDHEPKNADDYLGTRVSGPWTYVNGKKEGQYITSYKVPGSSGSHYWIMYGSYDTARKMYFAVAVEGPFPS